MNSNPLLRNPDRQSVHSSTFQRLREILSAALWGLIACGIGLSAGCGTTTNRIATEQLLMSDAVDRAIAAIDFRTLEGKKVYLDTLFLRSVKGVGFVNSEYIISSLRQQLTAARCRIQDSRDEADVIVEPRVGALGTDGHEVVYGLPQTGAINSAATMLSGTPMPAIPEISFGKANAQSGIAKIIVYAYDRQTREPIWQSGIAKAESSSRDTWFLGAGPFQKGSIYDGMRFAGKEIPSQLGPLHSDASEDSVVSQPVPYDQRYTFAEKESGADTSRNPTESQAEETIAKREEIAEGKDSQVRTASHEETVGSD
jgi:hypothetical protein